jgi:hypothetical protein
MSEITAHFRESRFHVPGILTLDHQGEIACSRQVHRLCFASYLPERARFSHTVQTRFRRYLHEYILGVLYFHDGDSERLVQSQIGLENLDTSDSQIVGHRSLPSG